MEMITLGMKTLLVARLMSAGLARSMNLSATTRPQFFAAKVCE
jgi:hypothetical protein